MSRRGGIVEPSGWMRVPLNKMAEIGKGKQGTGLSGKMARGGGMPGVCGATQETGGGGQLGALDCSERDW